ncbi:MAG: hypothetical protein IPO21_01680 [Bacteroidales bacterium]|nr:hypothetical protein [Bacteroidales bacterium]
MEIGLAIIGNIDQSKSDLIITLSDELKEGFKNKNYGASIKSYTIGVVCVAPQFEQFFKETKPKYTKGKKIINPDGIPFTLEDSFEYSIKIDFDDFTKADKLAALKIITKEILFSLKVLDELKGKFKDFNTIKFKEDLELFFKERKLV